jgi:photosystem II stability/assembly factor-like uncharacterized protein
MRPTTIIAALALLTACRTATTDGRRSSATDSSPTASVVVAGSADSLYASVRDTLRARGFRLALASDGERRLVVRAPDDETPVEVRIVPKGDSATLLVVPMAEQGDLVGAMRAMIVVAHVATIAREGLGGGEGGASDELPPSRWLPELFVTPGGRLWMARGGLFTADSARGAWRHVATIERDPVTPDELRTGTTMAFVGEDTVLVGLLNLDPSEDAMPLLFRTTDRGASWTRIPTPDLVQIGAMTAIGPSVWVFGTRWDGRTRHGTLVRSDDGGATWSRTALPEGLSDATVVHRMSPSHAWLGTFSSGRDRVFWRTTDGGATWTPVPTPHDQRVHRVPSYGVRIEEIATVGRWLVVREYGKVFVTSRDTVRWRPLEEIDRIASDPVRDRLFVLTDSQHAAMLDAELRSIWRTEDHVPRARPTNVENLLARDGVGLVLMGRGEIYEARDGELRLVRPRRTAQ